MAMLFRCDVCGAHLDRSEVFQVERALGSVLLGENMESFVPARQPDEHLLCPRCSAYFMHCVDALRDAGTAAGGVDDLRARL